MAAAEPVISLNAVSGLSIELGAPVSLDDRVEDVRSRVAESVKLPRGQLVLLSEEGELEDGKSLRDMLAHAQGEISISVLQQPCQLRVNEYHSAIDLGAKGFLKVEHIRFGFGHPLIYPEGRVDGFRHDDPPGTPDRSPTAIGSRWSRTEEVGVAEFPEPKDININMMPFIIGNLESLPEEYRHYWPMIEQCDLPKKEHGEVGYLTVQESLVKAGDSQRRGGLHIESPGSLKEHGHYHYTKERYQWGCGIVRHDESRVEGGLYMATTVPKSCRLWDVQIKDPGKAAGHLGNMEHMRDILGEGFDMEPGRIYWLTDATPHEGLPLETATYRQFFRLVTSSLSAWYPEHCTANPLVSPDPAVTQIVEGNKFES